MHRRLAPVIVFAALWTSLIGGAFRDATGLWSVNFVNSGSPTARKYLIESMVGGVAALDYDNDGFLDLYFVNGARLTDPMRADQLPDKSDPRFWNRLFRNNGGRSFTDVTEKAGVRGSGFGMGAASADFDNDGDADLYVTNWNRNTLYRNNGDGTFSDITQKAGVAASGWSTGAAFVDIDRDSNLDLVVARYVEWGFHLDPYCGEKKPGYRSYCHPDEFQSASHILFRNRGDGTFEDAGKESGITGAPGKGLGVAVNDFNADGWPDVFIANDSYQQQLFRNEEGRFREIGLAAGVGFDEDGRPFAGMGADFADYDNDGLADVFVNALANQRYALFRNTGEAFEYVTGPSGVGSATLLHSGWGAKLVDYNNDGWRDLFVAQGHVMDTIELTQPHLRYREPLLLLRNIAGKFRDVSKESGEIFTKPFAARGAAFADFDNDGRVDAAINCLNGKAVILRNTTPESNWLLVELRGRRSNRDGIGARIRLVTSSGREQYTFVSPAGSYLSSNDKRVHFGLGRDDSIASLEIQWPSGSRQTIGRTSANQILKIDER